MMKNLLVLIVLFMLGATALISQDLTPLTPQPRCAYIRGQYSAVFSLNGASIFLDVNSPAFKSASIFNEEMRKAGMDTLKIVLFGEADSVHQGVVLTIAGKQANRLLDMIPDQKIQISDTFPGPEGYIIDVMPIRTIITGSDEAGLFYGITTFFQMVNKLNMKNYLRACRVVDAPEFPIRWYYYPTNFLVGNNTTILKTMVDRASANKLNGAFIPDYKYDFISQQPQRYRDSLVSARKYLNSKYMKFVPGCMSFGYSNGLLYWDPNLASGLPVQGQKFVIQGDTAKIVPSSNVTLSNPGFETHNGNNFPGFGFIDQPGVMSFADTQEKHSGNVSIRFSGFEQIGGYMNARVSSRFKVKPYTQFHASAWVKTENLKFSSQFQITAIGNKGRGLCYQNVNVPSTTTGWQKFDVTFNSLDADTMNVYWGVWGPTAGKFWFDDLVLEEVAFVNLIRREGAPLSVDNPLLDLVIMEAIDYDSLVDKKMGYVNPWPGDYDSWHQPPTFRIKKTGSIKNGDTLFMSYYHAVVVYDGQVMVTMSDQKVYDIIERELKLLDSLAQPDIYFMNHDEIRTMNWDAGDQSRGLTPGQILGDNVNKCTDIIKRINPKADVWTWTDMFDPYHNAVPGVKNYYLVNGDLGGVADLIPNTLGMVSWNFGKAKQSLGYFSDRGFRQMTAPFYDQDQNAIRISKESSQGVPNFLGMLYTTWGANYNYLEHHARYCWNHAPYIYHQPPDPSIKPIGTIKISGEIAGDTYDAGWKADTVALFWRIDPTDPFSVEYTTVDNGTINFDLKVPLDAEYLQYYIEAHDNRGWVTKVPYGKGQYYEMGAIKTGVDEDLAENIIISPNPVVNQLKVEIKGEIKPISFDIIDLTGNVLVREILNSGKSDQSSHLINVEKLLPGMYFISIKLVNNQIYKSFIKL